MLKNNIPPDLQKQLDKITDTAEMLKGEGGMIELDEDDEKHQEWYEDGEKVDKWFCMWYTNDVVCGEVVRIK